MSNVTEMFGSKVFNASTMKERLPKEIYKAMQKTIDVFTSIGISFNETRSIRSKKGILTEAFPITVFLRKPEIKYAVSGGAFT